MNPFSSIPMAWSARLLAATVLTLVAIPSLAAMACPDRTFSTEELSAIIASARASRTDVPAPYAETRVQVLRVRCLYQYFEYPVPEDSGRYTVFTIDPYGGLMSFDIANPPTTDAAGATETP